VAIGGLVTLIFVGVVVVLVVVVLVGLGELMKVIPVPPPGPAGEVKVVPGVVGILTTVTVPGVVGVVVVVPGEVSSVVLMGGLVEPPPGRPWIVPPVVVRLGTSIALLGPGWASGVSACNEPVAVVVVVVV
jgi:hypothetical protein